MKDTGIIGMGVMGKSLARNMAAKGLHLALYNRHVPGAEENVAADLIAQFELNGAEGFEALPAFVRSIERPRKVLLMIPAGAAVDATIESLLPLLEAGDVVIDGGNSYYLDTQIRMAALEEQGIAFIGAGISGGEEGALHGPAIMAGGAKNAYAQVAPVLEAIAATDAWGKPCCRWVGKGGAGHFVKMAHNGIEYAEMQLIAEAYSLLRFACGLSPEQIAGVFDAWQQSGLQSYLLGITVDILRHRENGELTLDTILDQAGNKGTGSWTTIAACELGVPVPTLTAALNARYTSAMKAERVRASKAFDLFPATAAPDVEILREAYAAARIINHHQGFHLVCAASAHYGWGIDPSTLASVWTGGCIIQSKLMQEIACMFFETDCILLHPAAMAQLREQVPALAEIVSQTAHSALPLPCMESALSYFKAFTQENSSANLVQALRDYFGAHTYRKKNDPDGPPVHTHWTKTRE